MLYVNRKGSWQRKVLINYSQAEIPVLSLTGFVTLNHLALLGLTCFICKMAVYIIMHLVPVSKTLKTTKSSTIAVSYSVPVCSTELGAV